jgi:PPP family 3-phenylpropionic acid transporter
LIGLFIERFDIHIFFYSYIAFMGLTFLLSLFQPVQNRPVTSPLRQNLRRLLRFEIGIFLFSIFLLATSMGAVNTFFSIYLDRIGTGEGNIGLGWALAALSEVPIMIFSGRIIRRMGASGLLKLAFLVFALRWLLFSVISQPLWALLAQLLHGLSFAPFLVGGVTYISDRTPEGMGATAQAIFNTVTFGLGSITGSLLGGYLIDQAGITDLFRILSAIVLAGFALFSLGNLKFFSGGKPCVTF